MRGKDSSHGSSIQESVWALYPAQCLAPHCYFLLLSLSVSSELGIELWTPLTLSHLSFITTMWDPLGRTYHNFVQGPSSLEGQLWISPSSVFLLGKGPSPPGVIPLARPGSGSLGWWYSLFKWPWAHFPEECRPLSQRQITTYKNRIWREATPGWSGAPCCEGTRHLLSCCLVILNVLLLHAWFKTSAQAPTVIFSFQLERREKNEKPIFSLQGHLPHSLHLINNNCGRECVCTWERLREGDEVLLKASLFCIMWDIYWNYWQIGFDIFILHWSICHVLLFPRSDLFFNFEFFLCGLFFLKRLHFSLCCIWEFIFFW